jgi:hypothetical protein
VFDVKLRILADYVRLSVSAIWLFRCSNREIDRVANALHMLLSKYNCGPGSMDLHHVIITNASVFGPRQDLCAMMVVKVHELCVHIARIWKWSIIIRL